MTARSAPVAGGLDVERWLTTREEIARWVGKRGFVGQGKTAWKRALSEADGLLDYLRERALALHILADLTPECWCADVPGGDPDCPTHARYRRAASPASEEK